MAKQQSTNDVKHMKLGYALSSEEHGPRQRVAIARRATDSILPAFGTDGR